MSGAEDPGLALFELHLATAEKASDRRAQANAGSGKNLGRYAASWIACWPKRPSSTAART